MNKKFFYAFVLVLIFCAVFSFNVCAFDNGDFETQDVSMWFGGISDSSISFEGGNSFYLNNPYGEISIDGTSLHELDYLNTLYLSTGKIYTITLSALNVAHESVSNPISSVSLSRSAHKALITVKNVGSSWETASVSLVVPENGYYSFSFLIEGNAYSGVFVDNISVTEDIFTPAGIKISGQKSVYVPEIGSETYSYSAIMYDSAGNEATVFSLSILPDGVLPEGVSFDSEKGMLTVSKNAHAGDELTLICYSPSYINVTSTKLTVTLSDNIFENSVFGIGSGWKMSGEYEIDTEKILLSVPSTLNSGFSAYLEGGKMYVFSCIASSVFSSDDHFSVSSVVNSDATIDVDIENVGEQSIIETAFTPKNSGIYDIRINFLSPDGDFIALSNISLSKRESEVSRISLSVPGNLSIANQSYSVPFGVKTFDLSGTEIFKDLDFSLSEENPGIEIDPIASLITVSPTANEGMYTFRASLKNDSSVFSESTIAIGLEYIGDGSFENRGVNEVWATPYPSSLNIIDDGTKKFALINSNDFYSILLSNSYMHLIGQKNYIFSLDILSVESPTTMTAFIKDAFNSDNSVPICQAYLNEGRNIFEIFSVDENITGSILLYFESENGNIDISLDNISIKEAILGAYNVKIIGDTVLNESVSGSYQYLNNMTDLESDNASITRWYISSSPTGPFEPIEIENQPILYLNEQMLGQYVLFEVTPICKKTGLSSEPIRSAPYIVHKEGSFPDLSAPPSTSNVPYDKYTLVSLSNEKKECPFLDITGHWCEENIKTLFNAGVINGRSRTEFAPNDSISRAEFSALLIRIFSLVPSAYSGTFSDVSSSDWYASAIEVAVREGFALGMSDNTFAPNSPITREQIALMVVRAYYKNNGDAPLNIDLTFNDTDEISPWAYTGVKDAYFLGIIEGMGDNTFAPKKNATRAEAVTMLIRLIKKLS